MRVTTTLLPTLAIALIATGPQATAQEQAVPQDLQGTYKGTSVITNVSGGYVWARSKATIKLTANRIELQLEGRRGTRRASSNVTYNPAKSTITFNAPRAGGTIKRTYNVHRGPPTRITFRVEEPIVGSTRYRRVEVNLTKVP